MTRDSPITRPSSVTSTGTITDFPPVRRASSSRSP